MVKGINKQVIVVKAPDPRLFEEAIFILREGALSGGKISATRRPRSWAARTARADKFLAPSRSTANSPSGKSIR